MSVPVRFTFCSRGSLVKGTGSRDFYLWHFAQTASHIRYSKVDFDFNFNQFRIRELLRELCVTPQWRLCTSESPLSHFMISSSTIARECDVWSTGKRIHVMLQLLVQISSNCCVHAYETPTGCRRLRCRPFYTNIKTIGRQNHQSNLVWQINPTFLNQPHLFRIIPI